MLAIVHRSTLTRGATLVALATALAAPADARDWVFARSPGFVVVSDAGEKRAREVAHQFEQVRALFREVLSARVDPGVLVLVFAVRDEQGLRELLPRVSAARDDHMPAGLFMEGTDKHLVALRLDVETPNPYHVIYHEYVHVLARLNHRWLPLWLSEGLAEFYATADIDASEVRWGQILPHHVQLLRARNLLPVAEVMSAGYDSPLYNEARRVGPFYAQSAVMTHYLLIGEPKRRGQLAQFLKLLDQGVEEPEAMRQAFGDIRKLQGELDVYVRQFRFLGLKVPARLDAQAIRVQPLQTAEADALRGDFMARTGSVLPARDLLAATLRSAPDLGLAHEALGVLESFQGRRADALRELTEAVRLAPVNYVAQYRLGVLEGAGDAADRARREKALRSAIQVNPGFAAAHAALAQLLLASEKSEEAISLARRAVALDPARATHRVTLWRALERAGPGDEAALLEQSLQKWARTDSRALAQMVPQLESLERGSEAEALLKSALAGNPRNRAAASLLGDLLARQERWDEGEAVLRDSLSREPESARALNDLAYFLAQAGRKTEEALVLVERALKKNPSSPAYLDTKGVVLVALKRLPEAEDVLRRAAETLPDPEVLGHLGDVLLERGKAAEAVTQYERALDSPSITSSRRAALRAKLDRARTTAAGSARP